MLVCEDALGYGMLIRRWLEDADVEVVGEAATWEEAERLAAELRPDAVIADLWMPRLDTGALQRVRAAVPGAAIVSLSGLSADEAEKLVGETRVIDLFLSKRQPPAEIVEALRDARSVMNRLKTERQERPEDERPVSQQLRVAQPTALAALEPRSEIEVPPRPPRQPPSVRRIAYSVATDDFEAVARTLGISGPADVGRETFDYYYRREVED